MRLLAVLSVCASFTAAQIAVDLSGDGWTVQNLPLNISIPGSLPSNSHLDLYAADVIGEPYYGTNNYNLSWVMYNNWTYISDPIEGLALNENATTYLLFDGLDTFTTITFCNQEVGYTDNQFRQYSFDISGLMRNCSQQNLVLELNFGSAPLITQQIADQPGQITWPPGVVFNEDLPNRQWARKEQSDFGWDFAPAFAPAGPWKPAYVIQLTANQVYVQNSVIDIYRLGQLNNLPPDQSQPWVLNASVDVLGTVPSGATMQYSIFDFDSNQTVSTGTLTNVNITESGSTITGAVVLNSDYQLWWPNGMGSQKLYNVTIEIVAPPTGMLASVTTRTGFRTIVWNAAPISADQLAQGIANGSNWHFEINGNEFYVKGSNFVPPDAFWPRVDETRMRSLLQSAKDANQNFIRIWASGAYGPDYMFDIADELGILLWSEFEFSDALYPVDPAFLENVAAEANYQVRRLNHHPSLAAWVGSNEVETSVLWAALGALSDEVKTLGPQKGIEAIFNLKAQYETLFLDTLIPCVFGNTRSISYMPSSTNSGWKELNFSMSPPMVERYEAFPGAEAAAPALLAMGIPADTVQEIVNFPAATNESTVNYADTDFYDYFLPDFFDTNAYPRGRFAIEFGFYSYASVQSWSQVLPAENLRFNDSTLLSRNHQDNIGITSPVPNTNFLNDTMALKAAGALTSAVEKYYPTPNFRDPIANFSAWCQTTQIFQADFYRAQIQFYRWGSSQPWRQLGSVYWMLEDIWQTSSWSGIEYDGRWKYLHYIIKDVYQPVIISPFYNSSNGQLDVTVTSDLWTQISGQAQLTWYTWDGAVYGQPMMTPFAVGAINSTMIYNTTLDSAQMNLTNLVLHLNVTATGMTPNCNESKTFTHENFLYPVPLREAAILDPAIELSYDNASQTFFLTATKGIAPWTWLDYPEGPVVTFDSNAFTLIPGMPREIRYTVRKDDCSNWIDQVTVRSIWNNTLSE